MAGISERPSRIRVLPKHSRFHTFLENKGIVKPSNLVSVEDFRRRRVEKLKHDFREEVEVIMRVFDEEGNANEGETTTIAFPVFKPEQSRLGNRWAHFSYLAEVSHGVLHRGRDHISLDITDDFKNPTYKTSVQLNANGSVKFKEHSPQGVKQGSKLSDRTQEEEQQMELLMTFWENADVFLESGRIQLV